MTYRILWYRDGRWHHGADYHGKPDASLDSFHDARVDALRVGRVRGERVVCW